MEALNTHKNFNPMKERCEHCEKVLQEPVWLELSQTDGRYYSEVPTGHVSQGFFPFGKSCSRIVTNS